MQLLLRKKEEKKMDYKRMWNELKEVLIEVEESRGEFLRAGEILMRMAKVEVAESKKPEQLDVPSFLGGNKNGRN